jgi:hypothetical protein
MEIKVYRLTIFIINTLNTLHELIEGFPKFIVKDNQVIWQSALGLECKSELFRNNSLLYELYPYNKSLYGKVLIHFIDITKQTFMFKSKNSGNVDESKAVLRKLSQLLKKMPNKKYLLNNLIVMKKI